MSKFNLFSIIIIFFTNFLLLYGQNNKQYYGVHYCSYNEEVKYPFNSCNQIISDKGNKVSIIEPNQEFSCSYEAWKPAELTGKPFWFRVKMKVKSLENNTCNLVISAAYLDSVVFYRSQPVTFHNNEQWQIISDSVLFPYTMLPEVKYKVYLWKPKNNSSNDTIFIDDFYVFYQQYNQPDYLFNCVTVPCSSCSAVFNNNFFSLNIDTLKGLLNITDNKNDELIRAAGLFIQTLNSTDTISYFNDKFYFTSSKHFNDTTWIDFFTKDDFYYAYITIKATKNSPQIKFNIKVDFKKDIKLYRASLAFVFKDDVKYVYTPSGLVDSLNNLQNQYWIGKTGGCIIGKENHRMIYSLHNTFVSSTQIDLIRKLLVFNVDAAFDHPMLYMPLLDKESNTKQDISYTSAQNILLSQSFSIAVGKKYDNIPFINPHYSDYKSTLIFTEHADWANILTHKAVYWGSSIVNSNKQAIGGFVKYNLPVTKSVFYHNPYKLSLSQITNESLLQKGYASIKENKEFLKFLKELSAAGNELCLHTPEDKTTTYSWLEESLKFMQENFKSVTWIDHGYDNAPYSNREDLACDGANKEGVLYALPYWKKYNIINFWNPYFEDYPVPLHYEYYSMLQKPYSRLITSMPLPTVANHPNLNSLNQFYTMGVLQCPDYNLWNYYFSEQRLSDFIQNKATLITHVYSASIHNDYGFWKINDNKIEIATEFNEVLRKLADKRDKRLINVCTISEYIKDVQSKHKLQYIYTAQEISIVNTTNAPVLNVGIFYNNNNRIINYNFEPLTAIKFNTK